MALRYHRKPDEETTYWLSYSDMMAGLLLCFVLIISLTVLRSKIQYDLKQNELLGKEQELMVQTDALQEEQETVRTQQALLDEQAAQLELQASALADQGDRLFAQEEKLRQQSDLLRELQKLMDTQQAQLDKIIGVRGDLIEELKAEYENSDLHIAVDENTGAITFDSSILFEYNQDELKESGMDFLDSFFPRYVKILLGPKYREYVSEIIIEGHTDTTGNYLFNLELSQQRAYSVAEYCLSDDSGVLSKSEIDALRDVVSTSGRSWSDPILNEDGTVDMDASRRVEVLFRLKDEEMIREMIEILNSEREE